MGFFDFFRRKSKVEHPNTMAVSFSAPKTNGNIKELWDAGSEREWQNALASYYELMRPEQRSLERIIVQAGPDVVKRLDGYAFYEFLHDTYFVWKYTAKNRLATTRKNLEKYILNNELPILKNIQTRLFSTSSKDTEKCLKITCEIHGLGTAGASGLLALLFPEDFGTVDQFVIKRLQEVNHPVYNAALNSMNPEVVKIKEGVIVVNILKEKASELNRRFKTDFWTPRKIDMVLWSYGR